MAERRAWERVAQLAPELVPNGNFLVPKNNDQYDEGYGFVVTENGLKRFPFDIGFCCSETFPGDDGIPKVEKSLTIYLYWKLFPERFEQRDKYNPCSSRMLRRVSPNPYLYPVALCASLLGTVVSWPTGHFKNPLLYLNAAFFILNSVGFYKRYTNEN